MASGLQSQTIGLIDPFLYPAATTSVPVEDREEDQKRITPTLIELEDIKDISETVSSDIRIWRLNFLNLIGLIPDSSVFSSWERKLIAASIVTAITSAWITNSYYLSFFAILNIVNFLTSMIWDKQISFREKISRFVADFVLITIVATLVQVLLGSISVPFTKIGISPLNIAAVYMIVHYIYLITKRLIPASSVLQTKTLTNFILATRDAWEEWQKSFQKRQEEDIMRGKPSGD